MQVVWCPHPGLLNEYRGREKEVLAGLTGQHVDADDGVKEIVSREEGRLHKRVAGKPGEIDDGWAVLIGSLEEFDYAWFGIERGAKVGAAL